MKEDLDYLLEDLPVITYKLIDLRQAGNAIVMED
jgi:hypothetical protein